MKENEAQNPWQQVDATVYQLDNDGLNRLSFNVQGNSRKLKPGEDGQIAAEIVRDHNSYTALLEAAKKALTCASLNSDVRALIVAAIALAEKEQPV